MRRAFWIVLLFGGLTAQPPSPNDLTRLTRELRSALESESYSLAVDLATKLNAGVQRQYQAWLIRDAVQRVNEVLTWVPNDSESFWVNREPFTINPEESTELLYDRPIQIYSADRLMALNGGAFFRALGGHTVRLVVAAAKNIGEGRTGIPGVITAADVVYFYFFDAPVELPPADGSVQGLPVWRGTADIMAPDPPRAGREPEKRQDENWIALARPDLLILANRYDLLAQVVQKFAKGSNSRAFSADLPEWSHVDRTASFWGLRHYSAQAKPKPGEAGFEAAELPRPDGAATGVTVQFASAQHRIVVQYLSSARPSRSRGFGYTLERNFQLAQPEAEVWRFFPDVQARGPWPVHFAMTMLGFGLYR